LKGLSDTTWGGHCFRLAIAADNSHAEAYNNLGVLEARKGRADLAVAFFQTAASLAPHMYEPLFNEAKIADSVIPKIISKFFKKNSKILFKLFDFCANQVGDLQNSYLIVQKALQNYPDHADSKELFGKLRKYFEGL